jgi:putative transposase
MSQWLSIPQLDGLPGLPSSRPRRRELLERLGAQKRERDSRGGGYEYLASALPEEAQQALAARAASAVAGSVKPAADAIKAGREAKRSAQVQACADAMARWGVQLESRGGFDPATNPRLDLFQRFEAYHRARGGAVWPAITEFCALWTAGQIDALPSTKAVYNALPAKTLDKWYRDWRVNGVEALLERKPRKDKGQTALSRNPDMYDAFIGALAGIHDPTANQVRVVMAHQLGEANTPPAGTIKRWLRDFKATNKVALLRFKNPDAFKNKYRAAFGSISENITAPNQLWELDSTIADAMLLDPETGEIRRHAIISCIDVFTRRQKFLVSRTSSSNAIKALVRSCIIDWGKPEAVKTDNGKDYLANDFEFALAALQIGHKVSTPFSPEQKGHVERGQGTMLHDLFPMLGGFVGHSIEQRKAIDSALSFAERFGKKNAVIEFRLSPQQLQDVLDGWVEVYHQRDHSSLGCSPAAMAQAHTTHVLRIDERALDLLLMPVAGSGTRTVTKQGISLDKGWFRAPELAAVIGHQVRCRQDEGDLGALHVFSLDGSYICKALDHTLLGINRAELAAKSRIVQDEVIKPFQQAMQKAKRTGVMRQVVDDIYRERQDAAAAAAGNVTRLQPRVITETTPAVASVLAAQSTTAQDNARAKAREAFAEEAPIVRMDTPKQRYSAWVRLQARTGAGEQLGARDVAWISSYEGSAEFDAWHGLHEGSDPLAEAAG